MHIPQFIQSFFHPHVSMSRAEGIQLLDKAHQHEENDHFDKAIPMYNSLAADVDAEHAAKAQYRLGLIYMQDNEALHNPLLAFEVMEKAAANNHVQAQFQVGMMYLKGQGVSPDKEQAVHYLTAAAKGECSDAAYELGLLYLKQQDINAAISFLSQAAGNWHADACYRLGRLYLCAEHLDVPGAVENFEKAIECGHAPAMYRLGMMHWKGQGIKKNHSIAEVYFKKAAMEHYPQGAFMYALGMQRSYSGDQAAVRHYYQMALDGGVIKAALELGDIERDEAHFIEAVNYYQTASNYKISSASLKLAILLYEGEHDVPKDTVAALQLFQLASKQGNQTATLFLADWHRKQESWGDATVHVEQARQLYQVALKQGMSSAALIRHLNHQLLPVGSGLHNYLQIRCSIEYHQAKIYQENNQQDEYLTQIKASALSGHFLGNKESGRLQQEPKLSGQYVENVL